MSQRTALLAATALTVFVMILMVGVVWQVFQKSNVNTLGLQLAAPAQTSEIAGEPQAVSGPTQEQIAQREAAFQQLIQQANQKLAQSYQQQQDLSKQLQAEKQKQAPPKVASASQPIKYKVSAEQATSIALAAEKGAVLTKPAELVSYLGAAAYEVTLDRGVVYVDANSGEVLYDSAVVIVVRDSGGGGGNNSGNTNASPKPSAPASGGHETEHDSGHGGEVEHGD